MNALATRHPPRAEVLGLDSQDLRTPRERCTKPRSEIPFEDDAVDRIGGEPKTSSRCASCSPPACARDVTRINRDAADERIVETGDVIRFEPANSCRLCGASRY